jgi:glycosyltransferase involved in cell wall biosynthesis
VHEDAFLLQQLPTARPSLRVAVVSETYPPEVNGVAMTMGRMVGGLQARNHQVQLIRPRQHAADSAASGGGIEEVLKPGVPIPKYDSLRLGLPARTALTRLWQRRRPDVVHVATEGPLGWSAVAAARRLGIPVASDFHTNFHSYSRHYGVGWLRRPIEAYLRRFHNKAEVTLVPTAQMRRELSARGFRNVEVVSRGVDTTLFHPGRRDEALREAWGVRPGGRVVMVVGRLAAEKNLALAVSAFARMRERDPGLRLVLVGDGPERAALSRRCADAVFAGMRTGEDLARHYASADMFLFPSLTETFGNVTLEAMASGLAVLAFDYAAAREHLRDGESGLLVPFDDADAFERRAVELATAPGLDVSLGHRARATAETLDWEHIHDGFERVLMGLARRGDAP